jgi:dienelactone hydrolase
LTFGKKNVTQTKIKYINDINIEIRKVDMKSQNFLMRLGFAVLAFILSGCVATSHRLKNSDGTDSFVQLKAYQADEKKSAPTVLVGHGSGGVGANMYEWASAINSWGYNAVVIDHYTLRGITSHPRRMVAGASPKDRAIDFANVAKWVQLQPWHKGKIAIMGFSHGGSGVLAYADGDSMNRMGIWTTEDKDPVAALISFYPACYWTAPPETPQLPVLMFIAEKDDLADPKYCSPIKSSLYDVHTLKNATHSFDENIPSGARLTFTHRYSTEAITESKSLTKAFLAKYLN